MNWMQLYEVAACAALAICCVAYNVAMCRQLWITRVAIMCLGVSALIRGAALVSKYAGLDMLDKTISAAADSNIPLMTALVLGSIVWQRINKSKLTSEQT
jgi:hypothetical protein